MNTFKITFNLLLGFLAPLVIAFVWYGIASGVNMFKPEPAQAVQWCQNYSYVLIDTTGQSAWSGGTPVFKLKSEFLP